ncbi:MAG: prephenate dehydrogenase/arogenate dehydrogenase family protein, partial [Alphaproteobacteria bacterium]|nr:prephenate dehydrogenase/arogenate dehydrogenase family protein [Alphaproteobacteria bacterium]
MTTPPINNIALIGIGLINSSLARAVRLKNLSAHIAVADINPDHLAMAQQIGLGHKYCRRNAEAVAEADLVIIGTPLGATAQVLQEISPHLKQGCIVTDVGSVKRCVVRDCAQFLPAHVFAIPGHPIAGTEHSGPAAGFAELFQDRFCVLVNDLCADEYARNTLENFWRACGAIVEWMEAAHHDQVLAITSHLPHLIAYTIVGTATDLAKDLKQEVIRYSASGFRDFTRIAASDPTMWRDVFMTNRDA